MTDIATRSLALPDLRVVPVDRLVPHEHHDHHRMVPLTTRLKAQGILRNPPVVTPVRHSGEERYVVLDGANRTAAARASGLLHLVVQVVPYEEPDVRLLTWNHALVGESAGSVLDLLSSVPEVTCSRETLPHARALVARREVLAYVSGPGPDVTALAAPGDFAERNRTLNRMVEAYRQRTRVFRVGSDSLDQARERIAEAQALVVFPRFLPAEVLELASSGEQLPAGITRHLVAWRALRVNLPLEYLGDPGPSVEEKQAWLRSWMRERRDQGHVRFYEESTVLFDE